MQSLVSEPEQQRAPSGRSTRPPTLALTVIYKFPYHSIHVVSFIGAEEPHGTARPKHCPADALAPKKPRHKHTKGKPTSEGIIASAPRASDSSFASMTATGVYGLTSSTKAPESFVNLTSFVPAAFLPVRALSAPPRTRV